MTTQEYLDLRNGVAVRGVASKNAANAPITLTEEAVERIAEAFCVWLISRTGKTKVRVALGHDSRRSSSTLYQAVLKGVTETGHDALSLARCSPNAMFSVTQTDDVQRYGEVHGGIYVTADGLSAEYNGLSFFYRDEELSADDVRGFLQIASDYRFAEPNVFGTVTDCNALPVEEYSFRLVLQGERDGKGLGQELVSAYEAYASDLYFATLVKKNCQGLLLAYDDLHGDGSVLLRARKQDDALSIDIESNRADDGVKIVKDLYYFLKKYDFVDVTPLEEAIYAWREVKTLALKEKFAGRKLVRVQF